MYLNDRSGCRVVCKESMQRAETACRATAEDPQFLSTQRDEHGCGEEKKRGREGGVGGRGVGMCSVHLPQSCG